MRTPKQLKPVYRPDYLLALADYLANVDNQFDLGAWVGKLDGDGDLSSNVDPTDVKRLKGNPKWKDLKTCGTTACAMGHAPSVPLLAKAGLTLKAYGQYLIPAYKGNEGFKAAQSLFGISNDVANHFFDGGAYDDEELKEPKAVAKRLYEFVADPFVYADANGLDLVY